MFEQATGGELLDVMRDAQRGERMAFARVLLAAGRFTVQRIAASGQDYLDWCVDYWDVVAAEIAAELGISRGRASSWMDYGQTLIERLPTLGEVFAAGAVDFRVIRIVDFRTALITDEQALAAIDEMVAYKAPGWNALSDKKLAQLLDWMVLDVDPDAVRVAQDSDDDRHFEVGPAQNGMAEIFGSVRATDGAALNARLAALAASVCRDDPRSTRQRRADTISALLAGASTMACQCGSEQCPAGANADATSNVVIHVVAEEATVNGEGTTPGFVAGYGVIPPAMVREVAKTAKLKPVIVSKDIVAQSQYRPSTASAELVRCRDLTCRWPGCDKPAWQADIDHTVPYPWGPTHPSNNGCFCRFHHLMKTFHGGTGGWDVVQQSDGTMVFTTPSGRMHTTKPFGAMLFPQLGVPTGELDLPDSPPPGENRGLKMPKRKRTRAQERAYRIQRERNINAARYAADPPPF